MYLLAIELVLSHTPSNPAGMWRCMESDLCQYDHAKLLQCHTKLRGRFKLIEVKKSNLKWHDLTLIICVIVLSKCCLYNSDNISFLCRSYFMLHYGRFRQVAAGKLAVKAYTWYKLKRENTFYKLMKFTWTLICQLNDRHNVNTEASNAEYGLMSIILAEGKNK